MTTDISSTSRRAIRRQRRLTIIGTVTACLMAAVVFAVGVHPSRHAQSTSIEEPAQPHSAPVSRPASGASLRTETRRDLLELPADDLEVVASATSATPDAAEASEELFEIDEPNEAARTPDLSSTLLPQSAHAFGSAAGSPLLLAVGDSRTRGAHSADQSINSGGSSGSVERRSVNGADDDASRAGIPEAFSTSPDQHQVVDEEDDLSYLPVTGHTDPPHSVPEPGSLLLLATGAAAYATRRIRRATSGREHEA